MLPLVKSSLNCFTAKFRILTENMIDKTAYPQHDNTDIEFTAPPDKPFTKAELKTTLNLMNDKKKHQVPMP